MAKKCWSKSKLRKEIDFRDFSVDKKCRYGIAIDVDDIDSTKDILYDLGFKSFKTKQADDFTTVLRFRQ
jgi:adenylate cyclase class IV